MRDGDILCYQVQSLCGSLKFRTAPSTNTALKDDPVTEDSSAFVIVSTTGRAVASVRCFALMSSTLLQMDGSLCGYFNKAFSQRANVHESFQVWNARQAKLHGVLIDFGEFQTTYSSGGPSAIHERDSRITCVSRMPHNFALVHSAVRL